MTSKCPDVNRILAIHGCTAGNGGY